MLEQEIEQFCISTVKGWKHHDLRYTAGLLIPSTRIYLYEFIITFLDECLNRVHRIADNHVSSTDIDILFQSLLPMDMIATAKEYQHTLHRTQDDEVCLSRMSQAVQHYLFQTRRIHFFLGKDAVDSLAGMVCYLLREILEVTHADIYLSPEEIVCAWKRDPALASMIQRIHLYIPFEAYVEVPYRSPFPSEQMGTMIHDVLAETYPDMTCEAAVYTALPVEVGNVLCHIVKQAYDRVPLGETLNWTHIQEASQTL